MFYSFQRGIYQYLFLTLILIGLSSGGLESNIICRFPGNGHNVFWTGDFVSGTIELVNNDYKDLKLKSIDAQLIGEFVYTKETERNPNKWIATDRNLNKSITTDQNSNKSIITDRNLNKSKTTDRKTFFKKYLFYVPTVTRTVFFYHMAIMFGHFDSFLTISYRSHSNKPISMIHMFITSFALYLSDPNGTDRILKKISYCC
jgi:hypothetical protein